MEATVILTKCKKNNGIYGVRVQRMEDGDWWRTWSFPVDEKRGKMRAMTGNRYRGIYIVLKVFQAVHTVELSPLSSATDFEN